MRTHPKVKLRERKGEEERCYNSPPVRGSRLPAPSCRWPCSWWALGGSPRSATAGAAEPGGAAGPWWGSGAAGRWGERRLLGGVSGVISSLPPSVRAAAQGAR